MLKKIFRVSAFLLWLGFLFATAPVTFGQQIITINPQSNSFVVVKNVPFSQYQGTGVNYVFPVQPGNGVTILFSDGSIGPDNLTVTLACTIDPTDAAANSTSWFVIPTTSVSNTNGVVPSSMSVFTTALTLPLTSTNRMIVQSIITGGSQCSINLSGAAASADLLTMTVSVSPTTPFMFAQAGDPCLTQPKIVNQINIVAAGNATVINTPSPQNHIYLCGYTFTFIGPSQTLQFASGSSGSCTVTANPTGAMGNSTLVAMPITIDSSGTVFYTLTGQPLCAVVTGAAVNIQGHAYYVANH